MMIKDKVNKIKIFKEKHRNYLIDKLNMNL